MAALGMDCDDVVPDQEDGSVEDPFPPPYYYDEDDAEVEDETDVKETFPEEPPGKCL